MPTQTDATPVCGLAPEQTATIRAVLSRFPQVQGAILYGSRAMGRHRPGSDIDLALLGDIDLATLNRVSTALDDLVLPFEIDLSVFQQINNPQLREHVQRVGVPL